MSLSLKIENVDQLPDGGPVTYTVDRKGLDIGRDPFMDWTLPDPQRFISGTHCHIRYQDGGYWLHDVSTNGTMVNGAPNRLTEPYKLNSGDRIHIGGYIVAVTIAGDAQPAQGGVRRRRACVRGPLVGPGSGRTRRSAPVPPRLRLGRRGPRWRVVPGGECRLRRGLFGAVAISGRRAARQLAGSEFRCLQWQRHAVGQLVAAACRAPFRHASARRAAAGRRRAG